jgi:hypothetical protein
MKIRVLKIILLIVLFFIFACNKKAFNKNEYAQLLKEHPATDSLNYPQIKGEWTSRVFNLDELVASFIKEVNQIDGFEETPIPSSDSEVMEKKLELISKSFHPGIKKLFDQYVIGVYFCERLGGTGLTGFVYDNSIKKPIGGFIVIDTAVIKKKANDWITFKEKSVFSIGDIKLEIQIEKEENNTIDNALRYILLHEMGHVISNTLGITPDLRENSPDYSLYPFFNKTWVTMDRSIYDQKIFTIRPSVNFYASDSNFLNLDKDWNRIYPVLQKTNFPTLYAATNALDHFAEVFVSYIHCVIDNKPWELTLTKNSKVIYRMRNRIHEMEREKEFLRRLIFK